MKRSNNIPERQQQLSGSLIYSDSDKGKMVNAVEINLENSAQCSVKHTNKSDMHNGKPPHKGELRRDPTAWGEGAQLVRTV